MSFDLDALRAAIDAHGPVARVVVAGAKGSAPREVGAAMLVWSGGQSGTIGGGALEWEAAAQARAMLEGGRESRLAHLPLGPSLGQCCGGAVTLVTEVFAATPQPKAGVYARAVDGGTVKGGPIDSGTGDSGTGDGGTGAMPLAVARVLDRARAQGCRPPPHLLEGWLVEPVTTAMRDLWIWGAGHVGRALVAVLAPLPGVRITWVDVEVRRFPDHVPADVTVCPAARPEALIPHAAPMAEHLILTFSHTLDLALCHGLLAHGFARCGLIGSATKWARFRSRLAALGHAPAQIARIQCPIGTPGLGKHPQAIAIGVAAAFLTNAACDTRQEAMR